MQSKNEIQTTIEYTSSQEADVYIQLAFAMLLNEKVEINTNSSTLSDVASEQSGGKTND